MKMQIMKWIVLLAAVFLSGCGQKGELYHPAEQAVATPIQTA